MSSKTVTKTIDAGVGATGIAISNGKVYVSNTAFDGQNFSYGQGTVTVIEGATGDVVTTINVATNPQSVEVAPDGMLHVTCTGDYFSTWGKVEIINPDSRTLSSSRVFSRN